MGVFFVFKDIEERERKKILRYFVNYFEYECFGIIWDNIGIILLIMIRIIGNIVSCFLIL